MKCAKCGNEFEPHHGNQRYCSPECAEARKRELQPVYNRRYYVGHAEKAREYRRRYYAEHRDEILAALKLKRAKK